MTITLTPEQEAFVAKLLSDGFYESTEAVAEAALTALAEAQERGRKLAELRREIDRGMGDIEAGRYGGSGSATELLEQLRQRKATPAKVA